MSLNPATGEVIATVPAGSAEDVDRAVRAAADAFAEWFDDDAEGARRTCCSPWRTRSRPTRTSWHGSSPRTSASRSAMARDEVAFAADNLRFFAGAARCMQGQATGEYLRGYTSWIRREPLGVVGQITPWNYPLMMAAWKIGAGARGRQHRACSSLPRRRR